jgi:hypothetical protein
MTAPVSTIDPLAVVRANISANSEFDDVRPLRISRA